MSHFGRSGPPDITDTYSLLILNISFRTTADDLFPLFDKYGKVVDVFIPRDRRTGESRGFAFVRYKYADEAQKAVDKLDGRVVDGREIGVQFAKYGPNAERIDKGRVAEPVSKIRRRSRSRSPHPRYRDDCRDRDYRRKSRSRSRGRYDRDRYRDRERSYRHRSRSYSPSPDRRRDQRAPKYDDKDRSRSGSYRSSSRSPRKAEYERSPSPNPRPSTLESPDVRNGERVSELHRDAPSGHPADSPSASPHSP
ncbi:serine/arginine-rich splicing factor SC35-like isoform X2 [Rhodamnia argentea]|uniref:Serine/arginine-rich splicing factor SC35-like isoform X1 n=1 Tax=Rhodamnia argentea TaxID=178133 RepID=A0A8B8Q875_9MYRT|nr:serine/arginine-rich splicing factor SC35-like isoform X2 [Rhodamnia argentea]XP_048130973.1 serine/arginine-rich splicing factor SC35-like isoform X2 [Rhodamnia argentea]XP_048130974.1 serine/arginine-rich splicing factor SC35-like isoform X2 [Rhodamnia argentea]XP_048130975.1 serine/arginine-rich splicing factor SC35-like isoform X2 [Rhodamnia argentea]